MVSTAFRQFVQTRSHVRRRWTTLVGFVLGSIILLSYCFLDRRTEETFEWSRPRRSLMQAATTADPISTTPETIPEHCIGLVPGNESKGMFLPDLFTLEQRRHGAVILHVLGLIYMFVALAIVCDEFFVPALGVITEKLQLSDDVAGATFMAAGGSAPEFFTSVIGVFVAKDNVGIGTIVGSATFNILCVLAFCCLFSKGVLHLTWWPLFRDVSFYIAALALVVIFFLDEKIKWPEALTLFIVYMLYCAFMKYNEQIEIWVKTHILRQSVQVLSSEADVPSNIAQPAGDGAPAADGLGSRPSTGHGSIRRRSLAGRRQSIPILHSGAMFRNGIVQLMVHTLDPLSELHVDDKLVQLQGMASVKVVLDRSALPQQTTTGPMLSSAANSARTVYHNNPSFVSDSYPTVPGTPEDDESNALKQRPTSGQKNSDARQGLGSLQEEPERHQSTSSSLALPQRGFDLASAASSGYDSGSNTPRAKSAPLQKSSSREGLLRHQPPRSFSVPPLQTLTELNEPDNYDSTQQRPQTQGTRMTNASQDGDDSYQNMMQNGQLNAKEQANKAEKELVAVAEEEEAEEPLDVTWPTTGRKQCSYLLLAPIVFPLWLTLPDVRRPQSQRYYPITFVGAILWIAFFSYLMVWWAKTIGETAGIKTEVMGLTVLAAGTSIPDLITSVIVARKGLGDMAVSSSIGSNIFDVCMGMPIPWLLWFLIAMIKSETNMYISVLSKGLICSVGMLFIMLIVLVIAIAICNWKMNKMFGVTMILCYFVFVVISVMLEENIFKCPLGEFAGGCSEWIDFYKNEQT